jgi:hypothetical protein
MGDAVNALYSPALGTDIPSNVVRGVLDGIRSHRRIGVLSVESGRLSAATWDESIRMAREQSAGDTASQGIDSPAAGSLLAQVCRVH